MADLKSRLTATQKTQLRRWFRRALWALPHRHNLQLLALKYGTDKRAHGYIDHYARVFGPIRKRALNILEIGVGGYKHADIGGESLHMWRDYFPNSRIYGLDIEDKKQFEGRRITIFQGDQSDPESLRAVAKQIGRLDIIIDDGSHVNEHIITTFHTLFPLLAADGIYAIEDLHTSYWPQFGGNWRDLEDPRLATNMLKGLVHGLHHAFIPGREASDYDRTITGVEFHNSIAFVFKGDNSRPAQGYHARKKEQAALA